jgi:hypothetical protein
MTDVCKHLDRIELTELPEAIARLRGLHRDRRQMGASEDVPDLRAHRLLRQLAEPACLGPRSQQRAPDRSFHRAGRGVELVLRRRSRLRREGRPLRSGVTDRVSVL